MKIVFSFIDFYCTSFTAMCIFIKYRLNVLQKYPETDVELKTTACVYSFIVEALESILLHINIKIRQPIEEHNSCPWEFRQIVGKARLENLIDVVYQQCKFF